MAIATSAPGNRNLFEELRNCEDSNLVDGLLDDIGFKNDKSARLRFLYEIMGVTQTFECTSGGEADNVDTWYEIAKDSLALQLSKKNQR